MCWWAVPLYWGLLTEKKSRFASHQHAAFTGFNIIPSATVTLPAEEFIRKVTAIAELYKDDLPSSTSLNSELGCWHVKWTWHSQEHRYSSLPSNPLEALRHTTSMYPNILVLLSILSTIPVTSCSAKRSFSGLKEQNHVVSVHVGSAFVQVQSSCFPLRHGYRHTDSNWWGVFWHFWLSLSEKSEGSL